ncbi:hypothetical protein ACJX0J_018829, partial [Zea mays]
ICAVLFHRIYHNQFYVSAGLIAAASGHARSLDLFGSLQVVFSEWAAVQVQERQTLSASLFFVQLMKAHETKTSMQFIGKITTTRPGRGIITIACLEKGKSKTSRSE